MTDEQIKQNAKNFAINETGGLAVKYYPCEKGYIAGAHSRDKEIEDLKFRLKDSQNVVRLLQSRIDELCHPWISVEDKLPQLNKICFGMRDGKMPRICMLVKKKNGECVFNTPNEEYEYPKGKITHWMPIPELPKGGEK